jgi:superfamily II RNA helicase
MVKYCNTPYPTENQEKYKEYFEYFSYELHDFQKYSIEAVVEEKHVIVSAPTGSGKTVSGEFALQYFVKKGKKVIYLSPIKALTNQKYYDFTNKYPDIRFGISTGDIKFNPTADCIIMTNEILMNYLFNIYSKKLKQTEKDKDIAIDSTPPSPQHDIPLQDNETHVVHLDTNPTDPNPVSEKYNIDLFDIDIENELACVVMDEVHVINDEERGHALEKIIMMLPSHICMVMMSGTLDNPLKFAEWVENCKMDFNHPETNSDSNSEIHPSVKEVYLAITDKRIVPLTHYAFVANTESSMKLIKDKTIQQYIRNHTNQFIKLQNEKNVFLESGYKEVARILEIYEDRQITMYRKHVLNQLAVTLREKEMLPAIFFVFSRKQVEMIAKELTTNILEFDSKVPYTIRKECNQFIRKLPNAREYFELPEYNTLVSQLESGIGMHHSGMIPILRELVELMIDKKHVKILVATESFAVGLNCPIRTAVFTGLTKHDGKSMRFLETHEYTQAAGRAGRLGIDTVGHVIHCNDLFPLPTMTEYKNILCARPPKLSSKFTINYSMILSLIKRGMSRDFHLFASKSMINNDLIRKTHSQKQFVFECQKKMEAKRECLRMMTTPVDICIKYEDLEKKLAVSVNKKRKETEKEIKQMKETYPSLTRDCQYRKEYHVLETEYNRELSYLKDLEEFIYRQTNIVCQILNEEGFIYPTSMSMESSEPCSEYDSEEYSELQQIPDAALFSSIDWSLTEIGKIASYIGEIHPLVVSTLMKKWNYMEAFDEYQIIGLFSCFVEIKIPEDKRQVHIRSKDHFLNHRIQEMNELLLKYEKIELEREAYTGIKYANYLLFDVVDEMMEWARNCVDEKTSKYFLQTKIYAKSISIGDFTKACIKISTISKEFISVCEYMGKIDCVYKLSKIERNVLKYIATTQSLYL